MTSDEHLAWAKRRALARLERDPEGLGPRIALTSLLTDLRQHRGTRRHPRIAATMLLLGSEPENPEQVRLHIQGYE